MPKGTTRIRPVFFMWDSQGGGGEFVNEAALYYFFSSVTCYNLNMVLIFFSLFFSKHKVQEGSFKVTRMRCWRITASVSKILFFL